MGISFSLNRPMITKTSTGKIVRSNEEISVLAPLGIKKIVEDIRAKKSYYPQPGSKPLYIPMGFEGPTLKIQAAFLTVNDVVDKTAGYTSWRVCQGGDLLLVVSNCFNPNIDSGQIAETGYHELPDNTYWWLDDLQFNRQGGYMNRWDIEIDLVRCWYDTEGNPLEV